MISQKLLYGICITIILVGGVFGIVGIASASNTYYVAPEGDNSNPGTEAQPWKTIQKAADTLVAGDTVYIKNGTYNEKVTPQNSGSLGNYITYTAYPGDTVTIDGTGITLPNWYGVFDVSNRNYIKVSGLRIINSAYAGIFVGGSSHIIIEKSHTYNTYSSGIAVCSGNNIIIDANEVELACNDGDQECITVAVTDTFEVKNNHVHHGGPGTHGGEGIDVKAGSSNGKIYKNHVHNMNRVGIYIDAWNGYEHDIDVYQNIVHDNLGDSIALATEDGGHLENIRVYNNIVYNVLGTGLSVYSFPGVKRNIKVINNDFYNCGTGIGVWDTTIQDFIIRNNICSKNSCQIQANALGNLTIDHNLIDGCTQIYGDDPVIGDPMFINPSEADFHLQENSSAIDNGSSIYAPNDDYDENPRPQGAGYDIGAYEACELPGDYPPYGEVTLTEVVDFIVLWSWYSADLGDVINLINVWTR